ncbi:MAG: hypothetical protein R3E48_07855 [Burkholderiaceae bacterium]
MPRQEAIRWHRGSSSPAWPFTPSALPLDRAVEGQLHYGFAAILSAALWIGVALLWAEGLRGWVEPCGP